MKHIIVLLLLSVFAGCSCHSTPVTEKKSNFFVTTKEEALKSSVLVEFGFATGSGFVFDTFLNEEKTKRCYKIFTAAHVLKNKYNDYRFPDPIIRFTIDKERVPIVGEVTYRHVESDTAIITAWTDNLEQLCLPFRIVTDDTYLEYTTKVYMISYPQAFGPMLTEGIISGISILDWDRAAFTTTAQSAPGSSGGPVIKSDTGEVVGMLKAIVTLPGSPHMFGWQSIVAPASDIRNLVKWSQDERGIIPGEARGLPAENLIIIFTPARR